MTTSCCFEVTLWDSRDAVHLSHEVRDVQLGPAKVRESSTPNANANGDNDRTSLVGPRAIAVELLILDDRALVARVMRFADPGKRWRIRVSGIGLWPTVEAEVRSADFRPMFDPGLQQVCGQLITLNAVVPGGLMYGVDERVYPIDLSASASVGRVYNRRHNWRYGHQDLRGAVSGVLTVGWYRSFAVVELMGTLTAPTITNTTSGESLPLPGLELATGEVAVVDFAAHSVMLGDRRIDSVIDQVTKRWWSIEPGVSTTIRVTTAAAAAPARALVKVRDAYL